MCKLAISLLVAAAVCSPLATGQTVIEVSGLHPSFVPTTIDFDHPSLPVGSGSPVTVAQINAAGAPVAGNLANITMAATTAPAGVYNTNPGNGRALGWMAAPGNIMVDPPTGAFDAFRPTVTLGVLSYGFGLQIGDWSGPMTLDFYNGPTLVTSYTSVASFGTATLYFLTDFQFDGVSWDYGLGGTANFVITQLDIQTVFVSAPPPLPPISGVVINEFFTGAIPAVEIYNSNTSSVDLSGFTLASWTDTGSGLVADPTYILPAGTTVAGGGFVVLEAGGTAGTPGTYPSSIATGNAYAWTGAMSVELALIDGQGAPQGVDYVFYDHFGTVAGAGPNLPSPTAWTGDFDTGTGDTHVRLTITDTDTAADWTKVTFPQSLGFLNPPQNSVTGITINEFYTGSPNGIELHNPTTSTIDISGLKFQSWTCTSSTSTTMVADPVFTIPAGTMLASKGFLTLEEGGVAGAPGTYPTSMYTGITYGWTGAICVELAFTDSWNVGLDYAFYDHWGNFAGLAPNLPAGTAWTGNFAMGTGDTHERVQLSDTDAASDWAKNANIPSLGHYNPPQASGVVGILINEASKGNPDWIELLNTTANPVDVSGYVMQCRYSTTTTMGTTVYPQTCPPGSIIPAGGVMNFVELGTPGAPHATLPNTFHTGTTLPYTSSTNVEIILYGPLGLMPLDYVYASVNEVVPPTGNKPGTLNWDGQLTSVATAYADIFGRITLVDRDNAGDWLHQGLYTVPTDQSPGLLNPGQLLPCNGYFKQYGTGCTSALGNPVLFSTGCPTPGGAMSIEVAFAPSGAPAMLVIGLGSLSIPLSACCNLQVNPIINPQIFLTMPASTLSLPTTLPAGLPVPVSAYVQMLFGDPANPCGISSTNPLQIHFQ